MTTATPLLDRATAGLVASALSVLVLGFVLGLRHATDADHVVAVSTIASRARSAKKAIEVGVAWGLGHALTVLVVGGAIVLFGVVIPPRLGLGMELSVAVMLIVLGAMNLSGAVRHLHDAAHTRHDPARESAPAPLPSVSLLRSMGVGVVHGMAGSAAVALLVLATIDNARWALLYLAIFGLGTIVGMVVLTSAMAVPVAVTAGRFERAHRRLSRFAGALSVIFGLFLAYRIGFVEGLFRG